MGLTVTNSQTQLSTHACKGLYPGSSLRGEVQKDVATFSLGLIQGEKDLSELHPVNEVNTKGQ